MDTLAVESGARDEALQKSGFDPRDVLPDITAYYTINNWKAAWIIARQWIVIIAVLAFAIWSQHWGGYLVAMLVAGWSSTVSLIIYATVPLLYFLTISTLRRWARERDEADRYS